MLLSDLIKKYCNNNRTLFTTPSHDGDAFVIPGLDEIMGNTYLKSDLSETEGCDNYSFPSGVILDSQNLCAKILNVPRLFFLINGSSSGIIAAMCTFLKPDDKVLIAANCHKCVYNGLVITGAFPVVIFPEYDSAFGIHTFINPQKLLSILQQNPDIKVFIMTSPTYEGVSSDIRKISEICKSFGVKLIVDEAHGALKNFAPEIFSEPAILSGADISVNSLHKNCGAPNPAAVLYLSEHNSDFADKIQNSLNLINTSSPSYPLLASIELTLLFLSSHRGKQEILKLYSHILDFKNELSHNNNVEICNYNDPFKLLIKINGLSGFRLSEILSDKYNIEDESAGESSILFLTGIGTLHNKLIKLSNAISQISLDNYFESLILPSSSYNNISLLKFEISPREAFFRKKISVDLSLAIGKIAGELILDYPPGIPFLIPGQIITPEITELLRQHSVNLIKIIRQ